MYGMNDERFECCVERAAEINADPPNERVTLILLPNLA